MAVEDENGREAVLMRRFADAVRRLVTEKGGRPTRRGGNSSCRFGFSTGYRRPC